MPRPFTGVILAAGMGTRLGEMTRDIPKPLLAVNGKPLIAYGTDWMRAAGAERVVVVGGYRIEQLRAFLSAHDPDVIVAENPDFATTQRMVSLLAAEPHVTGDLLVQDGDYIFTRAAAEALEQDPPETIVVHGTRRRDACWSAMDVIIRTAADGSMTDIFKTSGTQPLGTGEYYFNSQAFWPADAVAPFFRHARALIAARGPVLHVEDALMEYVRHGKSVNVRPIETGYWVEVDTPSEKEAAERFAAAYLNDLPNACPR
ncbi:hypothetical protein EPO33_02610 [Patescibacteria group bacterium]|nr:MAG: hypothetical protein EPO33_02610 [Patescibacteria group bacterium]